jgi:hypothetical protein
MLECCVLLFAGTTVVDNSGIPAETVSVTVQVVDESDNPVRASSVGFAVETPSGDVRER